MMLITEHIGFRLTVAMAIGLLVGVERERRKGTGPHRAPAGLRTFALAGLLGGLSLHVGGSLVLAVAALMIVALAMIAYRREPPGQGDPGVTTEVALLVTFLLGALAIHEPKLASGLGVGVAIILAARRRLHRFVRSVLSEHELHDGLVLATAALVLLPLIPDRAIDPFGVLNPKTLWVLAVVVMAISTGGHVALRLLGPRFGLPLAGLASGFVSSVATIATLGARSAREPAIAASATAGAVLSSVATIVQMLAVLAVTSRPVLAAMAVPLALVGAAAVGYGLLFALRRGPQAGAGDMNPGHAFDPKAVLIFVTTVAVVQLLSAAANHWLGHAGSMLAAVLAGFADTHSAAISTAALVAAGQLSAGEAVLPILLGLSTNTVSRLIVARATGDRGFSWRVIPGLVMIIAAAWAGFLVSALRAA